MIRTGKYVRDEETGAIVKVQKRIMMVCPRELHNFMLKDFPDAIVEGNKVLVSEDRIRKLLKTSCSHVKKFTKRDKEMCGCHWCIIFEDIHKCLIRWRKERLKEMQDKIKTLRGRRLSVAK